jgi:hypothetical protein
MLPHVADSGASMGCSGKKGNRAAFGSSTAIDHFAMCRRVSWRGCPKSHALFATAAPMERQFR